MGKVTDCNTNCHHPFSERFFVTSIRLLAQKSRNVVTINTTVGKRLDGYIAASALATATQNGRHIQVRIIRRRAKSHCVVRTRCLNQYRLGEHFRLGAGRCDLAEAGGKDPSGLPKALEEARRLILAGQ